MRRCVCLYIYVIIVAFNSADVLGGRPTTNDYSNLSSRRISLELFSMITNSSVPQAYVAPKKSLCSLIRVYSGIECSQRGYVDKQIDNAVVQGCFELCNEGVEEVHIAKHVRVAPLVILRNYTFNYFASLSEIHEWWSRERNRSRIEWARTAVDDAIEGNGWGAQQKYIVQETTINYRVHIWNKAQFLLWWKKWRNRQPRDWALDTLEWGIDTIGDKSTDSVWAVLAVDRLLPQSILKNYGVMSIEELSDEPKYLKSIKEAKRVTPAWSQ